MCAYKKHLLFQGLEFEKVLIEEAAAGRRAVACLVNITVLWRGEDNGSKCTRT